MSFRIVLKVSFLVLLAMALAATSAHCRLDLFGHLLTSKNQPNPNFDEAQVQVIEKEKSYIEVESSGTIPYLECVKTCDLCLCTLRWPPESNVCICGNRTESKKPVAEVQEAKPSSSKVKSEIMPYSECQKTCKHDCACTLIWPPELSTCVCGDCIKSSTTKAAEELHKELDLLSKPLAKSVGGFIPYPECIEKCDECVICTRNWPMEKVLCYCGKNTDSDSKKPAIEYAEKLLTELDITNPVAKSVGGILPYPECIEKCDECVICTRNLPKEAQLCYCGKKTDSDSKKLAIEYAEKLLIKLDVANPVAKSVGGFIPYPECIEKCDECVICTRNLPKEAQLCYCGKKTDSDSKKPAIKYAEKLLTKLDVANPVAKSVGGFIPYLECIEKCDECKICTLIYPIEAALCYCGKKTEAEGRALPI